MGAFIKGILVLLIAYYLITRVGKFFAQLFTGQPQQQQQQRAQKSNSSYQSRRSDDSVKKGNIFIKRPRQSKDKDSADFKGGEYVDYEEIK